MAKPNNRIFIIDGDAQRAEMLRKLVQDKFKLEILSFTNGSDAMQNIGMNPTYVLLDYNVERNGNGNVTGQELLKRIRQSNPDSYVVVMSSDDKIDVAADAMKAGAFDYVVNNPYAFLRIENNLGHIKRILRYRRTISTYGSVTVVLITLLLASIVGLFFIMQNSAG
jgi:DNA-binding NtrC family response regulator